MISVKSELTEQFRDPSVEWRGKPFWSWNGWLEEDELLRQIQIMRKMGFGGFFMHSRTGLATEYLSDEWFRLINNCADEAEKLGMEAWLYDEDRWPSGTAGGLVTKNPQYRARSLCMQILPADHFHWNTELLAAFICHLNGFNYRDCKRLTPETPPSEDQDQMVLSFTVQEEPTSTFYNGYTYLDTLNPEATAHYIELTHERYRRQCSGRLGKSIKGVFTDEPHRGAVMNNIRGSQNGTLWKTPWTAALPDEFAKRFQYDLVDRLPELFLLPDGKEVSPAKWHYMELLQAMFLDHFARPIYDWCERNHLYLTGHVLHEDSLSAQAAMQGSLMRFYEVMHYPGVDVLSEGNRNYWLVKQLTSVARQLGQKWLLSELYGCTGWQMSFEAHKAVGDWQTLFGINLRCHHLSWYTMAGEAKRDYPASILHQSAWWPEYNFVETYFARLGLLLNQGEPCCDLLVINPIESVWCRIHAGWADGLSAADPNIEEIERSYRDLFIWLSGAHIDFDYADEEMFGRLASVIGNANSRPILQVGQARYRAVLIGKMTTIRSSTLKRLENFRSQGGTVIFAGVPPAYVDAVASADASVLAENSIAVTLTEDAVIGACKSSIHLPIEVVDENSGASVRDISCQLRADDDHTYLIAMNMSRERSYSGVKIGLPVGGSVAEWDCRTGERYLVDAARRNGRLEWKADFAPSGERAYVISERAEVISTRPKYQKESLVAVEGPFHYRLAEPNVCVLDFARCSINGGEWQPRTEILKVDRSVRAQFGIPQRSGHMVQPWYRLKFEPAPSVLGRVALEFDFKCEVIPEGPLFLVMEQPRQFAVTINGHPISTDQQTGWWVDIALQKIELSADRLMRGANTIRLETDYRDTTGIEAIYLLGQFGVATGGGTVTLGKMPDALKIGDLTGQGLSFYGSSVIYEATIPIRPSADQRLILSVPKFEGACINVRSGKGSRIIAFPPYEADVTDLLEPGKPLEIEVVLTRRNTFGPLHQVPMRAPAYGPESWRTQGESFSDDYMLYPAGLLEPPILYGAEIQR